LIQARGAVARDEMYHVFNMGLGMLAIVAPAAADSFRAAVGEDTWLIGQLQTGPRDVRLA
jgi:phosphoribosylformylglycinamidine cyclo-ligase